MTNEAGSVPINALALSNIRVVGNPEIIASLKSPSLILKRRMQLFFSTLKPLIADQNLKLGFGLPFIPLAR